MALLEHASSTGAELAAALRFAAPGAVIDPGVPGSATWDAALDSAGAVIARAIDLHPELVSLATDVSFEL